jgi:hypothetical protein
MPDTPADPAAADTLATAAFIERWRGVSASELSTAQSFVIGLCGWLGVAPPHATPEQDYLFERPVTFLHGNGSTSAGRIDCYRRGHFVLEAKKLKAGAHTKGFDDGMLRARSQGEGYARALPAAEGRPPFVLVVDVGTVIEVYAEFSRSGGTYTPFPDPRSHRIGLADLARPDIRERLRLIWTDPERLNPARISAEVTRDVAALLAALANSLESDPATVSNPQSHQNIQSNQAIDHVKPAQVAPETVASFLTRCLFSMFAEDVELLPKGAFLGLLKTYRDDPATLQQMLRILWADMDTGGFSAALAKPVLHFNGKLFKQPNADGYSLLLNAAQIDLLIQAAQANWREVEPAIFGTLLERALNPTERHALGAHYTPRAYVERLVWPTVIAPLRADWANAQAAALMLAREAASLDGKAQVVKLLEARAEVKRFHHQLCSTRVLDPACGSGNFLYVTLEHLKRLEGEVINQLEALGQTQDQLGFEGETVTLQQLRGIELNDRAAALAELVLWIGFLQWHIRTQGNAAVAEPVVHDYGNIEHRDAVLAWDAQEPAYAADGSLLTRWDGETFKIHPVTGALVPDEAAQTPQWKYLNPRKAQWPQADFIVGNPPFIGAASMRGALGDGYVQALRGVWTNVPESADFVMYWWAHAANLVAQGSAQRMGLITTNSLRQTFNRRVVQAALDGKLASANALVEGVVAEGLLSTSALGGTGAGMAGGLILSKAQKSAPGHTHPGAETSALVLTFAIPDHPWVDSANGAAVRIAMTVLGRGAGDGVLGTVTREQTVAYGEVDVTLTERSGLIHADLSIGANVAAAGALRANGVISSPGVKLHGAGFIVTPAEAAALMSAPGDAALELPAPPTGARQGTWASHMLIRDYRNGRDLTDKPRGVKVIDAFGLSAEQLRSQYPAVFQWLLNRVKPERDQNNRATYRDNWWIFGEPRKDLRPALAGLPRFIATVETAKHRTFQFLDASILPDNMLIAIASSDGYHLGVLSSQVHIEWALAQGGTLEDRPRYNKSRCFETFPFPDEDTGLTPQLGQTIASLAEQIDGHRKQVLGLALSKPISGTTYKANKNLTLTGLYNVLDKLRQNQPLTPAEKLTHENGLVSLLRTLHDELDAAVLQAYSWRDLGPEPWGNEQAQPAWTQSLLTRLVALNAQRAAEEQQGSIRWLRPPFQDPALRQQQTEMLLNEELLKHINRGLEANLSHISSENLALTGSGSTSHTSSSTPQAWPATLPEQVKVVAQLLTSAPQPLTLAHIEAAFKGRGVWKKALPTLLETLVALGRAQHRDAAGIAAWGNA